MKVGIRENLDDFTVLELFTREGGDFFLWAILSEGFVERLPKVIAERLEAGEELEFFLEPTGRIYGEKKEKEDEN